MRKQLINLLKFVGFFSIGFLILFLVYRKQNTAYIAQCQLDGTPLDQCSLIDKVLSDLAGVNYFWIFTVLFAFFISNISRAVRWNMLIHPLNYKPRFANSFLSIVLGYFANLGLPRMGEIVRAGTLAKYEKIPMEKVMGTVVTDRIIDVISLAIVIGLAFFFEYDTIYNFILKNSNPDTIATINKVLVGLSITGVFFIALFFLVRKKINQTTIYLKVKKIISGFWEGIKTVGSLKHPYIFLLHSINIWVMYFLMTYLCFFAFSPTEHLTLSAALTVFTFGSLGIVIPSPGGLGTYHFLVIAALTLYGISGDNAFSFANIMFFSIQLGSIILFGILSLILLPVINKTPSSIEEYS